MTPSTHKQAISLRLVKFAVIGLLIYWTLYALVVPVTVWDSQTYNLARLAIAHFGGLFGNKLWNEVRQVAFPWTFDAVHYPFLFLRAGYALPSFACFIGTMLIAHRMISAKFGEKSAWHCCLAMLSLPALVFQATSTKNDLAVVFGIACWLYALWRFHTERAEAFLFLAALALGFSAGAKSSGIPLLILLTTATIWWLQHDWRSVKRFIGWSILCFIFFGSIEIYLNNWITYGHPLGAEQIRHHTNPDGISGTLANFIRYIFGSINLGFDVAHHQSPIPARLADLCRAVLQALGLANKGYRWDFNDANMEFIKNGWEAGIDFGPLGTFSFITSVFVLLSRSTKDILWRMAAAGFASLLLVCSTTSWMPWNMRFLLLPFLLFTLVAVILFTAVAADGRLGRGLVFSISLFSAVAFPMYSYNKGPRDLWLSLADRPAMMTKERPAVLEIMRDLEMRKAEIGSTPILLCATGNSAVLPVLQIRKLHVMPSPRIDTSRLQQVASQDSKASVYILTLNRSLGSDCHATLLKKYAETDSALYLWPVSAPVEVSTSRQDALSFKLTSGWHEKENNGADWLCWNTGRGSISIIASTNTVALLSGQILSAQRPNEVDVIVNGHEVTTLRIDWSEWAFRDFQTIKLALKPGENIVEFVSHNPAVTLRTDGRALAIAVKNLSLTAANN